MCEEARNEGEHEERCKVMAEMIKRRRKRWDCFERERKYTYSELIHSTYETLIDKFDCVEGVEKVRDKGL